MDDPKQRHDSPIGREIRRRREALGLTREQVEERATLSPGHLNQIEGGERKQPRGPTLAKIAAALGCTVDELLHPIEVPESLERFVESEAGADVTAAEKTELAKAIRVLGLPETAKTYVLLLDLLRSRRD